MPAAFTDQLVFVTINKEQIPTERFGRADVLAHLPERQRRRWQVGRAVSLGNAYHGKVDIFFQTADGSTKRVQTTLWAADSEYLTLKAGVMLPLRAVLGVEF